MRTTALVFAAMLAAPLALATAPAQANPFGGHKTGVEITAKQMDALEVGKTTKDQIQDTFGAPTRREQLGDDQVWYYDYAKIGHFKNTQESTVFEFGKDGVLKRKSKGAAPANTGNPFTGG
jgi:outer membrane protein assembly factor BamE